MTTLKKYWPTFAHLAGIAIVAYSGTVQDWLLAHPAYSMIGGAVWGFLLHWAQSPNQKPAA